MTELEQIEEGADAPEIEISPYSEEDIETFSKL